MVEKFVDAKDPAIWGALRKGVFSGAVLNMRNSDYHALDAYVSSTRLKYMYSTSPAHYKEKYLGEREAVKQTDALLLGSLVHCLVLAPHEFEQDFFIMPEINLRTNDGKAQRDELIKVHAGKSLCASDLVEKAKLMAKSVLSHPKASLLSIGRKEAAFFWQCPYSGLRMKAKLDQSSSQHFVELKTTRDANPTEFSKDAFNMHYDLSLVHYRQGLKIVMGVEPPAYFACVENDAPFVCEFYPVGGSMLETGHIKWLDAVNKLERAMKTGVWNGYVSDLVDAPAIESPAWAMKQLLPQGVSDGI